jgi:tetratricopeptide (TPR) repeat protein
LYRFLRAEADRYGGRYEEAIRNYEFLLKLTQWAGYRDRALHGIADSYQRLGEYEKVLEWLAALKKSFPGYFEKHKLAAAQALAEARLERAKAGPDGRSFAGFRTGFEPGDQTPPQQLQSMRIIPGQGMAGPHVCCLESLPVTKAANGVLEYKIKNITPSGYYWVEFWYRDAVMGSTIPHLVAPIVQPHFYDTGTGTHPDGDGSAQQTLERGYGRWRKCAFSLRAPQAQDGRVMIYFFYALGVLEIDGLSIQPISDRQKDLLHNFVEGPDQ